MAIWLQRREAVFLRSTYLAWLHPVAGPPTEMFDPDPDDTDDENGLEITLPHQENPKLLISSFFGLNLLNLKLRNISKNKKGVVLIALILFLFPSYFILNSS